MELKRLKRQEELKKAIIESKKYMIYKEVMHILILKDIFEP